VENLIFSINAVLPIFLLMCLGMFFRRINLFDDNFISKANKFAFKILLPAHLFNNIYKSEISKTVDVKLIIFALVINVLIIGTMSVIVPKFERDKRNISVMIQGLYRSNFVLFGVPLSINLFGDSNVVTVITLIAIMIPFFNFTSVILLDWYSNDRSDYKKTAISIIKNPLIWGCILGIAVSVLNINIPQFAEKTVNEVAKMATPLALMALGGEIKIENTGKNLRNIAFVTVGKLLAVPAFVIAAGLAFGFRGVELGALFSMAAPSISVSSYTMAQQCDCNSELAGQLVFITTLFSPLTIFLFVFLLKSVGIF